MNPREKRPLRIVIAKPGLDGHDVGAKIVARALAAAGFEVVYTGLRKSPAEIARIALEEDADAVGLSILSGSHVPLARKVLAALAEAGRPELPVFVGGNIPERDRTTLLELGVREVFTTGTKSADVVQRIQEVLR